jgi:hypothetical protein
MRAPLVAGLTVEELVARFTAIAIAQDEALLYSDTSKYNRLYDEMDEIDKELRSRGTDARLALAGLYNHPNLQVRMKAAVHTLAIRADAREVLQAISDSRELPQAFHAGMTLRAIDRGIFKPT